MGPSRVWQAAPDAKEPGDTSAPSPPREDQLADLPTPVVRVGVAVARVSTRRTTTPRGVALAPDHLRSPGKTGIHLWTTSFLRAAM